ncbi:protein-export chaperone SecB [Alphaproteobacteria bacterium]|jgi:preprotein translocase subunit SecB|nr:protein-export chaperone SecB [Alphaproteobacteria bacterium]MDC6452755.1 protein-export chaperone SecB [Alphaproteobacteria bacterium]
MSNLRQSLDIEAKIIKHYIKDLSFENLQDLNNQNFKEDELKFSDNISAIFQTYNEKSFSVILKFICDCTLIKNNEKCFILEIDYFGLFEVDKRENYSQDELTKRGCILLYPILKPIVEDITKKGTLFSISLNNLDFNLIKN